MSYETLKCKGCREEFNLDEVDRHDAECLTCGCKSFWLREYTTNDRPLTFNEYYNLTLGYPA